MKSPHVSIIVRCYNEEQHNDRPLSGIMRQTVKDVDIILVDSGSTNATYAIATSLNIAAYAASKDATVALTRAMAIELASDNFRLNNVLSGVVDTPMLRAGLNLEHIQSHNIEILMHELGKKHVIGRVGQPEEIGQTIMFLADCQSSFISSQSIIVDGIATSRLSAG
jgi:NAD(P)-dependent dehydrogenase (short-subunit alcohol dehydrogenase family)